jgi:uncharacterized membrane protein
MREAVKDVSAWAWLVLLSFLIVLAALILVDYSGQAYASWAAIPPESVYPFGFGLLVGVIATFMLLSKRRNG